jgi:N-carbamoylputrescine amidase
MASSAAHKRQNIFLSLLILYTSITMATSKLPPYSYSPQELLQGFRSLKAKEEAALQAQGATATNVPQSTGTLASNDDSFVVAAVQLTGAGLDASKIEGFFERAQLAVQQAAEQGANLILLPELFVGPYFCQSQEACLMELACEADNCFIVKRMQELAKKYKVVLPISIFERQNNALYNSIVMIDADGTIVGNTYRKSHIPDGTGYQEKFYFSPGDSGFQVYKTRVGNVGVAICWDQWFPEAARAMALQGADVLLYPTAIGTEPQDPTLNSSDHWQRVMQGHAAANVSTLEHCQR